MEWIDIGRESLVAAKEVRQRAPRSAVSRAYYAVHAVLTPALIKAGYVPPVRRQTPPHEAQARLIGQHLADMGPHAVRRLRAAVRRLYAARLDADYNRRVTVDGRAAFQAIRDAAVVFSALEVQP